MSRGRAALLIGFGVYLAGGLQQAIAPRLGIAGAHPDFLLVLLAAGTMYLPRGHAALLGFLCGFVHGSLAGANLTHYVISRTVGGFLAAWGQNARFEPNTAIAFGSAFFLTLISQILLMFLAPPRDLGPFLGATIGSAVYNGVLILPVYFLLKMLLGSRRT